MNGDCSNINSLFFNEVNTSFLIKENRMSFYLEFIIFNFVSLFIILYPNELITKNITKKDKQINWFLLIGLVILQGFVIAVLLMFLEGFTQALNINPIFMVIFYVILSLVNFFMLLTKNKKTNGEKFLS